MEPIRIKVLPGEPTDGTGRVRVHWFVRDENGPAVTPSGTVRSSVGVLRVGGVRGRLACQQNQSDVGPRLTSAGVALAPYSDDVRGANCPECLATPEARAMLERLGEVVPAPAYPAKTEG